MILSTLFQPDALSWIMAALIVFVIATVGTFSKRYLAGDRNYSRYRMDIFLLGVSVLVMVFADHLLALLAGWGISNLLLVRLMVHKKEWRAARNSGLLAMATFAIGFLALAAGFWMLANSRGAYSIHAIVAQPDKAPTVALLLIALAAMTQSAIWPFHKWLTSSLNSPTPVSALMHAGLVNGGGFLLVRFAPLYLTQPTLLHGLFIAGLITAVLGIFWKLMQTDVKRMLACSTMGQMGFMIMQCGMGLFAPAVSHLVWHGLFKAYLFLSIGSTLQEKRRKDPFGSIALDSFALSCLFGVAGAYAFMQASGNVFHLNDTGSLMVALAFMATTQLTCSIIEKMTLARIFSALLLAIAAGGMYGESLALIELALAPQNFFQPQPLDMLYLAGFAAIILIWLAVNMNIMVRLQNSVLWHRLYVMALNASQPHHKTITTIRTAYHT